MKLGSASRVVAIARALQVRSLGLGVWGLGFVVGGLWLGVWFCMMVAFWSGAFGSWPMPCHV